MYVCAPRVCLVLMEVRRSEEGNGCSETGGMANCIYLSVNAPQTHLKSRFLVLLLLLNLYWRNSWCPPQLSFPLLFSFTYQVPLLFTLGFAVRWLGGLPRSYSFGVTNVSAGGEAASSAWTGSVRSRKVTEIGAAKGTCLFIPKTFWVPVTLLEGRYRCQVHHRSSQVKGRLVVPDQSILPLNSGSEMSNSRVLLSWWGLCPNTYFLVWAESPATGNLQFNRGLSLAHRLWPAALWLLLPLSLPSRHSC